MGNLEGCWFVKENLKIIEFGRLNKNTDSEIGKIMLDAYCIYLQALIVINETFFPSWPVLLGALPNRKAENYGHIYENPK